MHLHAVLVLCLVVCSNTLKIKHFNSNWNKNVTNDIFKIILNSFNNSNNCVNIFTDKDIMYELILKLYEFLPILDNNSYYTNCLNNLLAFDDIIKTQQLLQRRKNLLRQGKCVILTMNNSAISTKFLKKIIEDEMYLDVLVYEISNTKVKSSIQLGFSQGLNGLVNLQGRKLSVSAFQNLPFVVRDKNKLDGVEIRVIRELAEALNFSWVAHEPKDGYLWGNRDDNGHWTGLKGELARGETDLGIATLYLIKEHYLTFQLSYPYTTVCLTFLVPKPKQLIGHWDALLKPLQLNAWFGYILIAMIHILVTYIISKKSIINCIFDTIQNAALVSGPYLTSSSLSKKMLHINWIIGCFFVAGLYSSELSSWLVAQVSTTPIKSLEDFAKSRIIWGRTDSDLIIRLKNSSTFALREIAENFQLVNSEKDIEINVLNEDYAIFVHVLSDGYPSGAEYLSRVARSRLVALQECVASEHVGIGMRRGLPLVHATSLILRRLQEAGLLQQWQEQDVRRYGDRAEYKKTSTSASKMTQQSPLALDNLASAFTLFVLGHTLAFCAFCVEILLPRITKSL